MLCRLLDLMKWSKRWYFWCCWNLLVLMLCFSISLPPFIGNISKLHFTSTNNLQCGLILLPNCLKTISNRIEKDWLTLTKECYKQIFKKEFITIPLSRFLINKKMFFQFCFWYILHFIYYYVSCAWSINSYNTIQ